MYIRSSNGLFDELRRLAQPSCAMKWLGIFWLAAMACASSAWAEGTNVSTVATNQATATEFGLPQPTNNLPDNSRQLSMEECIRIALEHNFTIEIARFNPQIARYNLWGAYGVYDPTFTSGYE